jgi:thiol-disulfide isomerase/thioredoxin
VEVPLRNHLFILAALLLSLPASNSFSASIEGKLLQSLQLASPPLDLSLSPDGQRVFVLEAQKLAIYSIQGEPLGAYPLEKKVTNIKAQGPNLVLLYSGDSNLVDYLFLEVVHDINTAGSPVRGPQDAPVTITVFDDFQCPYCAQLEPVLKQVLQLYPEQVRLVFKNFPLSMHQFARPAALAALAAERQGKFWEYHDQLFANYNKLSPAKLDEITSSLQLDPEQFNKELADPALAAKIEQDQLEGQQVDVRGTPAVFINGRLVQDRSINGFRGKIEQLLQLEKMK